MKLSVVILNYNVRYFLELCLKSVQAAIESINAEIIVVDNASSDGSCQMVKQLFPNITLIENKVNSGFSKGNNIGVAKAKGEYICILNPDTVVAEDTFQQILDYAESKENLGIIGCQLIDGKGRFLPESKRNIPTPQVALKKMLGFPKAYYANQLDVEHCGKVEILVGAFMFLKKTTYEFVNGFDEDYFMYGEDIDLSYKILKAGYTNYYFGKTTVIHFKGESTLRDAKYAKRFFGAMQIFYKKHFRQNALINTFIWFGIKLAYIIRTTQKEEPTEPKETVVYADFISNNLKQHLLVPITLSSQISEDIPNNSMLVYDLNLYNLQSVIADMKKKSGQNDIVFRLLPKNSKFIIGSDSAINQGRVTYFN